MSMSVADKKVRSLGKKDKTVALFLIIIGVISIPIGITMFILPEKIDTGTHYEIDELMIVGLELAGLGLGLAGLLILIVGLLMSLAEKNVHLIRKKESKVASLLIYIGVISIPIGIIVFRLFPGARNIIGVFMIMGIGIVLGFGGSILVILSLGLLIYVICGFIVRTIQNSKNEIRESKKKKRDNNNFYRT